MFKSTVVSLILASLLLGAFAVPSPQPTAAPEAEACNVNRDCRPSLGPNGRCCHGFASNYCTILDPSFAC